MKWSLHCVVFIDCRLWEWGDPPLFWRKNTHMILFCIFKFEAHLLAFIRSIAAICFLKKKTTLTKISIFVQPYNLQMCMHFWGNSDSEWILFEWLDETGSKFWFQNTCEKVKSNFWNRNKNKIKKVPFFRDTLYIKLTLVSFFPFFCTFPYDHMSHYSDRMIVLSNPGHFYPATTFTITTLL